MLISHRSLSEQQTFSRQQNQTHLQATPCRTRYPDPFRKSHAHPATLAAILMTDKSSSMAEVPCAVASAPRPIEHKIRGQSVWTTVATRRLELVITVILGYEQKNQVVNDTSLTACSRAVTCAGHIVMDVGAPCTDGVCPYCGSSACKGNCGSTGGGFVCLLS